MNKYGFRPPQINKPPKDDVHLILVIPCFDEPDLISSLQAIEACDRPSCNVEVIVVLNSGEHHEEAIKIQNQKTKLDVEQWKEQLKSDINYFLIHETDLPKKHAGVGLARKIGMDEAVARFEYLKRDGIIVCFDADAQCDKNYLIAIEEHFAQNDKTPGCSIYFEHPLKGQDYSEEVYDAITNYELHLRYYKQCQEFLELPYAFHTVGSSMAVRASAYQKQGGMNKRKAGEDFYFIHKIVALGGYTTLNTTTVIPSPRVSERVPFGTGKSVGEWVDEKPVEFLSYNFEIFKNIKAELEKIDDVYHKGYELNLPGLSTAVTDEIIKHTSGYPAFLKRFYAYFDAFKLLKLVHYFRDEYYENQPILNSSIQLDKAMGRSVEVKTLNEQLRRYRQFDRTY